jgi:hypothetical protein
MITTWILFAFVGGQFWVVGSDYPTKTACLEDAKIVNASPEKDKNGMTHLAKCYPVTSKK